ncbi:patatin [Haematococcus lacustris]|uniref:Patatin n=1 Tax=Haematococcus lacustris TaxID=44745 RepID=A0A699YPT9_HAELA|nr:patatin [Haematococcus lacustris]
MTNSAARRVSGDFMPVIDDLQHLDGVVLREQEHCSPVLACHGVCNDQSYSCKPNDDLSVSDAPNTRLQEPDTGINPCFKAESHPEHPAVAAWKAGRLGLTFSGGGFLLSYHLGVLEALQGIGVIQPGLTPVAGASSGSLAAAAFHCHMTQPGGRAMACVLGLAAACRQVQRFTPYYLSWDAGPWHHAGGAVVAAGREAHACA